MRKATVLLVLLLAALPLAAAGGLQSYFIDVEGGQATLIVSPSGQSMLVDAGWPSKWGPGADRILAAAKMAGITQIDYMLVTHYHLDHVGGVPELAARIPIVTYVDHGPNTETDMMAHALETAYNQVVAKADSIDGPWTVTTMVESESITIRSPTSHCRYIPGCTSATFTIPTSGSPSLTR